MTADPKPRGLANLLRVPGRWLCTIRKDERLQQGVTTVFN